MYCPKCGAANQEDLAYCRECGDNLQILSQAIKKHSPVALISKLDAAIENKNERLRREGLLGALNGAVLLTLAVFTPFDGNPFSFLNVIMFAVSLYTLVASGWYLLAYHRSQELPSTSSAVVDRRLIDRNSRKDAANRVYCPRCGTLNVEGAMYCTSCGTSLDFRLTSEGMEKYLPRFLVGRLDALIARNEEQGYVSRFKSGWALLLVALIFLANGAFMGFGGNWGVMILQLLMGLTLIISNTWDLIVSRRDAEKLPNVSIPKRSTDETESLFPVRSKIALAVVFISFGAAYAGYPYAFGFGLAAIGVIAGTFLKAWWGRGARSSREDGPFQTENLPSPETKRLLTSTPIMPAVTEATTRPLRFIPSETEREGSQAPKK